jgi:hypothetical protein
MAYKAKIAFSFDGVSYEVGQAVNVTDEVAIQKLTDRGHIVKGEGTEAKPVEGESLMKKAESRVKAAETEKVTDAAPVAKNTTASPTKATTKTASKKAAKKGGKR